MHTVLKGKTGSTRGRSSTLRIAHILLVTVLLAIAPLQMPVRADDAPVAYAQSVSTDEDTPKAITLTASGSEPLTYIIVKAPSWGTLVGTAPNVTYTPNANYNGPDDFTFKVNDGQDSNVATVSITVNEVDDPPVADSQAVSTDEDTPKAITLTASDVEGQSLGYTVVSQPSDGVLSGAAPNVTYTPNANYNGPDSFTFKANDGTQDSNVATVSITVNTVEDEPVANDQAVSVDEDTPEAITLTASDGDNDLLKYYIVTSPTQGTLGGAPPNVVYTPDAGYSGPDSFTFKVNDGLQDSNVATVSITVDEVNDPPVADDQAVSASEDTPQAITLTASDPDDTDLTFSIVAYPSSGTLSGVLPNLTYTPDPDYHGPDSFTFKANDGTQDSNVATVSITVDPVEDPPVAHDQDVATDEDTAKDLTLSATDGDGDALTYTLLSLPAVGILSGIAPNVTYTPPDNYYGVVSFEFKANDGDQDSNQATIKITVQSVNDAPVADPKQVETNEDAAKAITLTASDVEGDTLTYHISDSPKHGDIGGTPPNVTYTPHANYNGEDSFAFYASDGQAKSAEAKVSIKVAPVNDPPEAKDLTVNVNEDVAKAITLVGTDVDQDILTYTIGTGPSHGSLSGVLPNVTYTPSVDYYGQDSFTYIVRDVHGLTDTATVDLTIQNTNDDPQAASDRATVQEDTPQEIDVVRNDDYLPDPIETLSVVKVTQGAHGAVTVQANGQVRYAPHLNYFGPDSFAYTISDGNGGSDTATVSITVVGVNDPPTAGSDNPSMTEDGGSITINVLVNDDYRPDPPEELTIVYAQDPANGTVQIVNAGKRLSYTPDPNFSGEDAFSYRISDGHGGYATAIVRVTVKPVNDAPVAEDDQVATQEDRAIEIDVLQNDRDIDSTLDPASVRVQSGPDQGSTYVNSANGKITYTPKPEWSGLDSFTYRVCDNHPTNKLCAQARVDISVGSVNDPPISNAGRDQQVDTRTRVTLDGSASYDPDNNVPLEYLWTRVSGPPVVLTDPTAVSPAFVAPDDPCVLVFALRVIDAAGLADVTPDQVVVTVNNQTPVSNAGTDKVAQVDSVVTLDGGQSADPDNDLPLSFLWTQTGGPTITLSDPATVAPTFTAPSDPTVLSFTLYVTDSLGEDDPTPDEVVIIVSEPYYIYLPSVAANHVSAPDLVVKSLTTTDKDVQLVIVNQGSRPVVNDFWVDVYINPSTPPTAVNQTFDHVGSQGMVWAVVGNARKALVPGGSITLRLNDAYYDPEISVYAGVLAPGSAIYAQVDSFNPDTRYGTVLESHEMNGGEYNNIYGPVLPGAAAASVLMPIAPGQSRRPPAGLPIRR